MKIAHHLRPACPCGAVGVNQSLRVDFEMGAGRRVDVGGFASGDDPPAAAKQDTASLTRMRSSSSSAHEGEGPACHFNMHRAWP